MKRQDYPLSGKRPERPSTRYSSEIIKRVARTLQEPALQANGHFDIGVAILVHRRLCRNEVIASVGNPLILDELPLGETAREKKTIPVKCSDECIFGIATATAYVSIVRDE